MSSRSEKYYKISTSGGVVFTVPESKIKDRMITIWNMIEDVGDDSDEHIPIHVPSDTFKKILKFGDIDESIITDVNKDEVIEKMRKENLSDEVTEIFKSCNFNDILDFIRASNFLDYKAALLSICKYNSDLIKELEANDIKNIFAGNITHTEVTEFNESHPDISVDDIIPSGGAPAPP